MPPTRVEPPPPLERPPPMTSAYTGRPRSRLRARYAHLLPLPCLRCGLPVLPDEPWDLDHRTPQSVDSSRASVLDPDNVWPSHRRCNRRHGQALATTSRYVSPTSTSTSTRSPTTTPPIPPASTPTSMRSTSTSTSDHYSADPTKLYESDKDSPFFDGPSAPPAPPWPYPSPNLGTPAPIVGPLQSPESVDFSGEPSSLYRKE